MEGGLQDYWNSILLGIVEGLTEFLPVSSTAHLRISQLLLGQDLESGYWKMFSVVIQLGAILAVVVYFWKRLWHFLGSTRLRGLSMQERCRQPLVMVMVAFVVTAIPCFVIDKFISEGLENIPMIGLAMIVGGIVMWIVDRRCHESAVTKRLDQMTLKQAVVIGFSQIFAAAFPGTSRSMATIAGGQWVGLDRSTAVEFSFFLSIPVMFAAAGFKLLQFVMKGESQIGRHEWIVLGLGFLVSFVVAWGVIAWFMQWVKRHGFVPFAVYRLVAGVGLLGWWWMTK